MSTHNNIGAIGEKLADEWLRGKGYEILHRNWRYSHYELDLVAKKDNWLHIVEVKCRNASPFGYPEDSVTKKKFKHLQRAVDQFLYLNPGYQWIQYNILSITLHPNKEPDFFLLEDVFL